MDKKFLFAMILSLGTVWLFNSYMGKSTQDTSRGGMVTVSQGVPAAAGQPVKVPTSEVLYKPLDLDVVMDEAKYETEEQIVEVSTQYVKASLSTGGAVLTGLEFKEHGGKDVAALNTIAQGDRTQLEQRKKGCFLLACDDQTPYNYALVEKVEQDNATVVSFKAVCADWEVYKTYSFAHDSYRVDVELAFEPRSGRAASLKPRLFFAAPIVSEIADDAISVIALNEQRQSVEKTEQPQVNGLAWYWANSKPLFGAEDRYFVHALFDDQNNFVQRAYVKSTDARSVLPILEGPEITEKSSWKLSFYMGPKLFDHMNAVDDRLEETLSFGWFSWICKMLLKLLAFLHDLVGNFGVAIILLAVVVKLPFTPLSMYARKQMEIMQHYQPTINKIRTKFKHDMRMQHEELMKFYREHNIAPTAHLIGCLPMLLQLPILFALNRVLGSYLDLYQAPFYGWVVDLSSKDPFYVIPILMGITMIWQQSMTPVSDEKQRVMMWFVSVVMTVVFAGLPAGLVLYWLFNNILTIAEDYLRRAVLS